MVVQTLRLNGSGTPGDFCTSRLETNYASLGVLERV
jgi:hypothetical protein